MACRAIIRINSVWLAFYLAEGKRAIAQVPGQVASELAGFEGTADRCLDLRGRPRKDKEIDPLNFFGIKSAKPPISEVPIQDVGTLRYAYHATGDKWVSPAIRDKYTWGYEVLTLLKGLLKRGSYFADIGANIGWFTIIGSRIVGENGRVFAFEPEPSNIRLLRTSVRENRCRNVSVFAMAAGSQNGSATLFKSKDNQGDHRLELSSSRPDKVRVRVRKVDSLLRGLDRPLDVVKIDTQGSEGHVLNGMRSILQRSPSVRLIMEYWPFGLKNCGSSTEDLKDFFGNPDRLLWFLEQDGSATRTTVKDIPGMSLGGKDYTPPSELFTDVIALNRNDSEGVSFLQSLETKRQ
jgi:FkbM family methyltransferase